MKKQMFSRIVAVFLSLVVLFVSVDISIFAEGEGTYGEEIIFESDETPDEPPESDRDDESEECEESEEPDEPDESEEPDEPEYSEEPEYSDEPREPELTGLEYIIASFETLPDDILFQSLQIGDEPELPHELTVLSAADERRAVPVTWESETPFDSEIPDLYVFFPLLPQDFTLADGVSPPIISVLVDGGIYTMSVGNVTYSLISTGNPPSGNQRPLDYPRLGTWTVTGFLTPSENVFIEDTVNGIRVTEISAAAFANRTGIRTVRLPQFLEVIHDNAFINATGLREVNFHETNLSWIGNSAFENTFRWAASQQDELSEIIFPDTLRTIGNRAFYNAMNLQKIDFGNGVEQIGNSAFQLVQHLQVVDLPASVRNGIPLLNPTAPYTVTVHDGRNFRRRNYSVPTNPASATLPTAAAPNGNPLQLGIGNNAFSGIRSLERVIIRSDCPDNGLTIGENAFSGNERLAVVTLGSGLREIRTGAFRDNGGLVEVNFSPITSILRLIGPNAFSDAANLERLSLPAAPSWLVMDQDLGFDQEAGWERLPVGSGSGYLGSWRENYYDIGANAFSNAAALVELKLPEGLRRIGNNAFDRAENLKGSYFGSCVGDCLCVGNNKCYWELIFPNSLEDVTGGVVDGLASITTPAIGDNAFINNFNLENIDFGMGARAIGADAFRGCVALKNIKWGRIWQIRTNAFRNTGIVDLVIPDTIFNILSGVFSYGAPLPPGFPGFPPMLETLYYKPGIGATMQIQSNTFDGQSNLWAVRHWGNITQIGANAFRGNSNLLALAPNYNLDKNYDTNEPVSGFSEIGNNAFESAGLRAINLPNVTIVGNSAFVNSRDLETAIFSQVTRIGNNAFAGNINLRGFDSETEKGLLLGDSLTDIGTSAFMGCIELRHLTLPNTMRIISSQAFRDSGLVTIDLNDGLHTIGQGAFNNAVNLKEITIPDSVAPGISGSGFHSGTGINSTFGGTRALDTVTFGTGVTTLPNDTFFGGATLPASGVRRILFNGAVNTIGANAFQGAANLLDMVFQGPAPTGVPVNAFGGTPTAPHAPPEDLVIFFREGTFGWPTAPTWTLAEPFWRPTGFQRSLRAFPIGHARPEIKAIDIPNAIVGRDDFAINFEVEDSATRPITWSLSSDMSFLGLNIDPSTGVLSGEPTRVGTFRFSVIASNYVGRNALPITLVVSEQPPRITTTSLPPANALEFYSHTLSATGVNIDAAPIIWTLEAGSSFPSGLTLNPNGTISGVPNELPVQEPRTFTFTVRATNASFPPHNTRVLSLTVIPAAPIITTTSLPAGIRGTFYSRQLEATGLRPIKWYLEDGGDRLPNGFSIDEDTGILSGVTNNISGVFPFRVRVEGHGDRTFTRDLTLNITENLLRYTVAANEITINGFASTPPSDVSLVIPPMIVSHNTDWVALPVTRIADNAFNGGSAILDLILPDSIMSIGNNAFNGASNLRSIEFGNRPLTIGNNAFANTIRLTEVTIPDNVTSIGTGAFENSGIRTLTIGDEILAVPNAAFRGTSSLTSVNFGSNVISIGDDAFAGATALVELNFPDSLRTIGLRAFWRQTPLQGATSLERVTFNDGLISIGDSAFRGASKLTEVILPDSVTSIGSAALTAVNTFEGNTSLRHVQFGSGLRTVPNGAFDGNNNLRTIVWGGITQINSFAFRGNSSLTEVRFPKSLETIEAHAFQNTTSLREVVFNDGLITINTNAFQGSQIRSLTIPGTVTTLGINAFSNLGALEELTILPGRLSSVPNDAFRNTPLLQTVTLADNITSIGDNAFNGTRIKEINLPNRLRTLGTGAFMNNNSLEKVTFGDDFLTIGVTAFQGTANLRDMIFQGSAPTGVPANVFGGTPTAPLAPPEDLVIFFREGTLGWPTAPTWTLAEPFWQPVGFPRRLRAFPIGYARPEIKAIDIPNATVGRDDFAINFEVEGNATRPIAWSLSSDMSFLGLRINPSTGVLSGVPVGVGTFRFSVIASNYVGRNALPITLVVSEQPPRITTTSLPSANALESYSHTLSATGVNTDITPIIWTLEAGSLLPSGLSLNQNGTISGIPNELSEQEPRTFTFTVRATNASFAPHDTRVLSLTVVPAAPIITTTSLPAGIRGTDYSRQLEATGLRPITWHLEDSGNMLPSGFSLDPNTGILSGVAGNISGVFPFRVRVVGHGGRTFTRDLTLNITENLLRYTVSANEITINGFAGTPPSDVSLVIPPIIESDATGWEALPVTQIAADAFRGVSAISELILPDSVTIIGNNAFDGTSNLRSIEFGNLPLTIGNSAFANTIRLAEVTIPDNVTSIGTGAFENSGIRTLTIGDGILTVPSAAFRGTSSLTNIKFGSSVHAIGNDAFAGATALVELNFPDSLRNIGTGAFWRQTPPQGATSLERVRFNDGLNTIGDNAFRGAARLTEVILPDSVTSIGSASIAANTFAGNTSLRHVQFGSGLGTVPHSAFDGNNNLRTIVWGGITDINTFAFRGNSSLTEVRFPKSLITIQQQAFQNTSTLSEVEFNDGLRNIHSNAFQNSQIRSLTIPGSVDNLGTNAFSNLGALEELTILPGSLLLIPTNAFSNTPRLHTVNLADNITEIRADAFNVSGIKELTLPNSLRTLGERAFRNNNALEEIKFGDALEIVSANAFEIEITSSADNRRSSLKKIEWNRVSTIGVNAFRNATSLETLDTGSVETINSGAFSFSSIPGLSKLKEISLPNVTTISNDTTATGAFEGNDALESVSLPRVTILGNRAFFGNRALKAVELPNIISIGTSAFEGNIALVDLTLGHGLNSIGNRAFFNCDRLARITLPPNVRTIGTDTGAANGLAFGGTTANRALQRVVFTGDFPNTFNPNNFGSAATIPAGLYVFYDPARGRWNPLPSIPLTGMPNPPPSALPSDLITPLLRVLPISEDIFVKSPSEIDGGLGRAFNFVFEADSGRPLTWTLTSGNLPPGLSLNGAEISGTPTEIGEFSFVITASHAGAGPDERIEMTLTVNPARCCEAFPNCNCSELPDGAFIIAERARITPRFDISDGYHGSFIELLEAENIRRVRRTAAVNDKILSLAAAEREAELTNALREARELINGLRSLAGEPLPPDSPVRDLSGLTQGVIRKLIDDSIARVQIADSALRQVNVNNILPYPLSETDSRNRLGVITVRRGDLNMDGRIDLADATLLARYVALHAVADRINPNAARISSSEPQLSDASAIARYAVLSVPLPPPPTP
jgi:hypothetical protein